MKNPTFGLYDWGINASTTNASETCYLTNNVDVIDFGVVALIKNIDASTKNVDAPILVSLKFS